jgi:hypothetical protein
MFPMGNETPADKLCDLVMRLRHARKRSNTPELLTEAANAIEDLLEGTVQIEEDSRPVGD